ncbi:MAG: gephyrin-like molybdotransferase Glp [Planctomycetota bacterium]
MLQVPEALDLIVQHAGRQPVVESSLEEAAGLVLAQAVVADLDSPPFAKALMDGFAVRNADLRNGQARLRIQGEIPAGARADRPTEPGGTYQIMTGAPLPEGADAVVMVERSRIVDPQWVELVDDQFQPGQNVMPRALEMKKGETVLDPGHLLGAPELGLLATVGCSRPKVYRRPTIAVLSTGDELVPPNVKPGESQIRNSNESTLLALAKRSGANVVSLGIARDNLEEITEKIGQGLAGDILLLSGGVSAGKRDLVPGALARHGVDQVFHKVEFKPGKPVWFGKHERGLVFGLPGNPVSVLVCFELFVRTALRARQQRQAPFPPEIPATLAVDFKYRSQRLTYHPAQLTFASRGPSVVPVDWHGSPDLRALVAANSLLVIPPLDHGLSKGTPVQVLPFSRES